MLGTREKRFLRYTSIGVSTFLLDLLLLFVLIDALQTGIQQKVIIFVPQVG